MTKTRIGHWVFGVFVTKSEHHIISLERSDFDVEAIHTSTQTFTCKGEIGLRTTTNEIHII